MLQEQKRYHSLLLDDSLQGVVQIFHGFPPLLLPQVLTLEGVIIQLGIHPLYETPVHQGASEGMKHLPLQ
jgi:hypothetical protein